MTPPLPHPWYPFLLLESVFLSLSCSCQQSGLTVFLPPCYPLQPSLSLQFPIAHGEKVCITRWYEGHLLGSVRYESCLYLSAHLSLPRLLSLVVWGVVPLYMPSLCPVSSLVDTVCLGPEQHFSQTLPRTTAPSYPVWLRPRFRM